MSILSKLITRIRLINIFLINETNSDDSNDKKFKNSKELINLNELLLNLFDNILKNGNNNIENKLKTILKYNIKNLLTSIEKEKTPQLGINKLEDFQIYSNIKRGNKFFPFFRRHIGCNSKLTVELVNIHFFFNLL